MTSSRQVHAAATRTPQVTASLASRDELDSTGVVGSGGCCPSSTGAPSTRRSLMAEERGSADHGHGKQRGESVAGARTEAENALLTHSGEGELLHRVRADVGVGPPAHGARLRFIGDQGGSRGD